MDKTIWFTKPKYHNEKTCTRCQKIVGLKIAYYILAHDKQYKCVCEDCYEGRDDYTCWIECEKTYGKRKRLCTVVNMERVIYRLQKMNKQRWYYNMLLNAATKQKL